ncbi:DUF221-domain-containing protein [Irpex rosettiformis]|uniref:DUF221-domain-containing protein n=1 Tax=Irpex rosettiformis TaxID=378272 RepID=A0ACB8UEJ5_9APHY|nr:DUF221-domain-containing protein [Irpex rosettiformis]
MSSNGPEISDANSASTSTFVTALVFNAIVFSAEIAAFTLLRPKFPQIYSPRTFTPSANYHVKPIEAHWWAWPLDVFRADFQTIQSANGLDAYFFVRFLWMMVRVLLPIWPISWIVLMPVDAINTGVVGNTGLDIFTFGNIGKKQQARYAAHLVLAWVFTFWILYSLRREMKHFVLTRQRWLVDPVNANLAQSNTLLVTGIPQKYLTEAALTDLFNVLPGGVRKVWLNRDLKEMPKLYDRQIKASNKLEVAETKLIKKALKNYTKQTKAANKDSTKERSSTDHHQLTNAPTIDTERNSVAIADTYVPLKQRPCHRLPPFKFLPFSLPLVGRKVDSIDWARREVVETASELERCRRLLATDVSRSSTNAPVESNTPDSIKPLHNEQTYIPLNAAFILFNSQIGAHLGKQALSHHAPYRMSKRYVNVSPEDVIWSNLNMNPYEARVRTAISWAATVALIIFWAVPVAFIGAVSNVHALCNQFSWLSWICDLPNVVVGIISGILPPALLAVLMLLLPIVLSMLSKYEGTPTRTAVELSLMSKYFVFQVVHSFLIVTVASGIIAALPGLLNNPASVPTLLAQELPKASNFFLTYVLLQGLSGSAAGFLTIVPLALYYVKLFILGGSPRSVYKIKYGLRNVSFGTLFPSMTLLVVITIAYSVISPIINGLAFVAFFLFFMLYKYLFLWQLQQPRAGDSGGLFFPKALQHVFVGLYIQEICLATLFFLAQNANNKPSALPQGALMIVLIVITIGFHLTLNNSYGPLISALPLSLSDRMAQAPSIEGTEGGKVEGKFTRDADMKSFQKQREDISVPTSNAAPTAENVGGPTDASTSYIEDFAHPATRESQQIVWIPHDPLGIGESEAAACQALGVQVGMDGAKMDGKGKVDVDRAPPGEDVAAHTF